ncbi:DUF6082 family protein [Streptomyces sp. NPDC000983]|uniref:DUF6082 family protein n=1 Tax=Streptomyces sp. NPDC000983 TaxID=3154373 RepID=UPI003326D91D
MRSPFRLASGRRHRERLAEDLLRQLTFLAEEIRHANVIQLHRIATAQLERALADPDLAEAGSALPGLSERHRRQVIYINMQYSMAVLNHRVGAIGWDELMGFLRIVCRTSAFPDYWEMTREHRRSLPSESLEARVGRAVDVIMDGLRDDPDEWWVVAVPDEPSS